MKRLAATLALVAVAAFSAACSSAPAQPAPSVAGPVDPNGPTVVAKDLKFQNPQVDVKAGQNFTLHFDNQDSAPHNIAIFTDSSAGTSVAVGQIVTSSRSDLVVPSLKAGSYFFRCDVHHDMTGTITAK